MQRLFLRANYFTPINFKSATDGTSNTLMIGESVVEQDYHSAAYFADGTWATCGIPLNFFIPNYTYANRHEYWMEARGFKSMHSGGAQFAMADGSVHVHQRNYRSQGISQHVHSQRKRFSFNLLNLVASARFGRRRTIDES